jgi:hypothetical protein
MISVNNQGLKKDTEYYSNRIVMAQNMVKVPFHLLVDPVAET